jgi:hypothetical protein
MESLQQASDILHMAKPYMLLGVAGHVSAILIAWKLYTQRK